MRKNEVSRIDTSMAVSVPALLLISALAGATDACGLTLAKDMFVSFMSGNTTLLGNAIADGDASRVALLSALIAMFVLGAASGAALALKAGQGHMPVVLLAVATVLSIAVSVPFATVHAMAFAMGILNAAMDHVGSAKVSITYVTGTLVKLGQGLGRRLCAQQAGWNWLEQGLPWVGLLSGVICARAGLHHAPGMTLAALPIASLALAVSAWLLRRDDPGIENRAESQEGS